MKRLIRILSIALILSILAVPLFAMPVQAASTLREYINTGGDANSNNIYGLEEVAQVFVSDSTAHSVTKIKIPLQKSGSPGDITLSLYAVDSGKPTGDALAYGTFNGNSLPASYVWITFTMLTSSGALYALSNSTSYAIALSASQGDSSNYVEWWQDTGGNGVATNFALHSHDGGNSWTDDSPKDCLFEVWGDNVLEILSANVFQSYLEDDDLLFTFEIYNTYPPYFDQNQNIKQYFQIQLIGLDNTTVLATALLPDWGYTPASLYLSANSAAPITISGAYYIKVIGTFSPNPYDEYTLTSGDWKGTNLTNLDDWVRQTAKHIQLVNNYTGDNILWEEITGKGVTLTDKGGGIFSKGIQGIVIERPDLFIITQNKPQFIEGTPNNAYDVPAGSVGDYRDMLGDEVADDLDAWGDLFSVNGDVFGGWFLTFLAAIVTLIGIVLGGRAGIGVFVLGGLPLILIGNYTHLIGIQWTLIAAILFCIILVRQFWWKST